MKNPQKGFIIPLFILIILVGTIGYFAFVKKSTLPISTKVFDTVDSIQVCSANCESLPSPVFKVCPISQPNCSPRQHYTVNFFLNDKPLLTFATPLYLVTEAPNWTGAIGYSGTDNFSLKLVGEDPSVTKSNNNFYAFNGTNKITIFQDDFIPLIKHVTSKYIDCLQMACLHMSGVYNSAGKQRRVRPKCENYTDRFIFYYRFF